MKKIFQKKRNNKIFIAHRCKKNNTNLSSPPKKNTNPQKNRADSHLKVSSERINYEKSTLV